jgi:precorrin-4/cobalt-precorrin-4 C11-methyltransferase
LITVRGAGLLALADVIIYAGSLVNPELLKYARKDCAVHNSASMTLEEVIELMKAAEEKGLETVRLHTGDPSLYGAVREQMDELDRLGIRYDVCPGVSAFGGAAAALKAEYTLPGVSQTLIITRLEGRTAVPEGERLRSLAAHGASLALYLSAGLAEKVSRELIAGGCGKDTPAAIVYRASWPDERVCRCTVGDPGGDGGEKRRWKDGPYRRGPLPRKRGERSRLYDRASATASGARRNESIRHSLYGKGLQAREKIALLLAAAGDPCAVYAPERLALSMGVSGCGSLERWTRARFADSEALVFVAAAGIAVRAIARISGTSSPTRRSLRRTRRGGSRIAALGPYGRGERACRKAGVAAFGDPGRHHRDRRKRRLSVIPGQGATGSYLRQTEAKEVSAALLEGRASASGRTFPSKENRRRPCLSERIGAWDKRIP